MPDRTKTPVIGNPWENLRRYTSARIALGRSGTSLPTRPHLAFQLAHARARKAVHLELDTRTLVDWLRGQGQTVVEIRSRATSRAIYLQRPDLGRALDDDSREALRALGKSKRPYHVALIIGDGLSATAIDANAMGLLEVLLPALKTRGLNLAPITVAKNARVALGDEVGELLSAEVAVMMIGERPGLSSPDSIGLYMTYRPRVGTTDEARNCISNVRPEGLSFVRAAQKLDYLLEQALSRRVSGIDLKDEAEADGQIEIQSGSNFLTAK